MKGTAACSFRLLVAVYFQFFFSFFLSLSGQFLRQPMAFAPNAVPIMAQQVQPAQLVQPTPVQVPCQAVDFSKLPS